MFFQGTALCTEGNVLDVGQNIKVRRLELGMSQKELADSIGYKSRSAIAKVDLCQDFGHKS
ncbi:helix-turn-helix transcriptional regulator [Gordonibacter sp.]|uniref:helix-turn-helix transcriptional regulator n=1 Tax=Gordonibacter sp. TaxID=1968902 RepID=UPI003FA5C14C